MQAAWPGNRGGHERQGSITVATTMGKASRKMPKNPAPITSHPLFPAVIALWLAVLFGLGSLALAPALPAMGIAIRLATAAAAALLGVAAGLFLGRRIARTMNIEGISTPAEPQQAAVDNADRDADFRRPISALEELGRESFDQIDIEVPAERVVEPSLFENAPFENDEAFPDHAEPYGAAEPYRPAETSAAASCDADFAPWTDNGPGDDDFRAEPAGTEAGRAFEPEPEPVAEIPPQADPEIAPAPADTNADAGVRAVDAAERITQRPLMELGMVELIERLAYAIQADNNFVSGQRAADDDAPEATESVPGRVEAGQGLATERTRARPLPLSPAVAPGDLAGADAGDGACASEGWDEELDEELDAAADGPYSSLLNMKPPAPRPDGESLQDPFGDPMAGDSLPGSGLSQEISANAAPEGESETGKPAVPGEKRPDSSPTEGDLRSALAALQRFSGAA